MAKTVNNSGKTITTQAGMDKAVKGICNILRRDKAKGARLYMPEQDRPREKMAVKGASALAWSLRRSARLV